MAIIKLTGELRPSSKLNDGYYFENGHFFYLPSDGTGMCKLIGLESNQILNFTKPIPDANGSYSPVTIEIDDQEQCYFKTAVNTLEEGFSISDVLAYDEDLAKTYTPNGHSFWA
ncbi:hypothetical protein [Lacihabitans lacunae]|uniref:Uncharacterized protein n=1 Tax=Lacihabitans lacunae TaxID=1028214 RepID=A0ABV7YXI0_9BACT